MLGISTMPPCSFDDVRKQAKNLIDIVFSGRSAQGKPYGLARFVGRKAQAEQDRAGLDRAARARRARRDADAFEVETHHDRLSERTRPGRVDRAADARTEARNRAGEILRRRRIGRAFVTDSRGVNARAHRMERELEALAEHRDAFPVADIELCGSGAEADDAERVLRAGPATAFLVATLDER